MISMENLRLSTCPRAKVYENSDRMIHFVCPLFSSLHCRCSLIPVSNDVCKAVPRFLFWAPYRLNNYWKYISKFPFHLIGKPTMAFSTGQLWCILKSQRTGGSPVKALALFCRGLNQSLVSSVAQAILLLPSNG